MAACAEFAAFGRSSLAAKRPPLPGRLHHHGRNGQADGSSGGECEQRDPHGAIFPLAVLAIGWSFPEQAVNAARAHRFLELSRFFAVKSHQIL
jgi:hypothetical protein